MKKQDMQFETLCLHADENVRDEWGTVNQPICQAATFVHKKVGETSNFSYSRLSNPTRAHLENTVAALENGYAAFAFSTGMAAVTCVMQLFSPPAHFIASEDLYGGSLRLFNCLKSLGYSFDFVDTGDVCAVGKHIKPETKAIYCETPSNPLMQVSDIAALSELAKKSGLKLIVDNTFLTPYFQKPLKSGADIVIHSGTKYLGGHNDTLAGFAVVNTAELAERVKYFANTNGACLSPFDSFLIERGIKTLAVRMDRINENAKEIAAFLRGRKEIKRVYYTGFEDHAGYAVSKKQSTGFGGMISFETESRALAEKILGSVKVIQYAESLGGTESLITYPMLQTHKDLSEEERHRRGINDRFLRLSVGIENVADLMTDLKQAIEK